MVDLKTGADQIGVASALSYLRIRDAVHLVRHRQHRLSEKFDFLYMDAQLAGVGHEQESLHTDEVTVIEQPEGVP